MYIEVEGGKGGNTVASLIQKYLLDQGLLDRTKQYELVIIMNNYGGRNMNNYVLCLAPS